MIREVARRASGDEKVMDRMLPVLEFIARRVPRVYWRLAVLVREVGYSSDALELEDGYLNRYLESAAPKERAEIWLRKADLSADRGRPTDELHALAEVVLATDTVEDVGRMANRINNKLQVLGEQKAEVLRTFGVREMIAKVAERMHGMLRGLSANDCSRLAWLMLNLGDDERARDVARRGLELDSDNCHCQRLVARLDA